MALPSIVMPPSSLWIALTAFAFLTACGDSEQQFRDINTRTVTLPDGQVIHAEVKADRQSQAVGMMYRESLAADRGMLFVYRGPIKEAYWMHNCKIALDIIWLDKDSKVVEVVPNAPPCDRPAKECPSYGGHETAYYVLELGAGQAKAHGVETGKTLKL